MGTALAVRARGITKCFGDVVALDGVDLDVAYGRVHGLAGPNGAGKTTLLGLLLGLAAADDGELTVLGAPVGRGTGAPDGVAGFVDGPGLYPALTARQNLAALAALRGPDAAPGRTGGRDRTTRTRTTLARLRNRARSRDPEAATAPPCDTAATAPHAAARATATAPPVTTAAAIDAALAEVGLTDVADDRTRGFSLGMRQRLGLAAALLTRPRLLVLDEPSNGLDPAGAQHVHAVLARLAAEGTAVVLSSHRMDDLEALCSEVTILSAGRVAFCGPLAGLATRHRETDHRLLTSAPHATRLLAAGSPGIRVVGDAVAWRGAQALIVRALPPALDALIADLVRDGIAIRELSPVVSPLESAFLALTASPPPARPPLPAGGNAHADPAGRADRAHCPYPPGTSRPTSCQETVR